MAEDPGEAVAQAKARAAAARFERQQVARAAAAARKAGGSSANGDGDNGLMNCSERGVLGASALKRARDDAEGATSAGESGGLILMHVPHLSFPTSSVTGPLRKDCRSKGAITLCSSLSLLCALAQPTCTL